MSQFYLERRLFTFLFISFLLLGTVSAQEDCATTLSKAQKQYDAGVIEQIPQMLQKCIANGFTAEEKLQAYKLIIMSYLFDGNSVKADKAMLDFLKRYPEYELLPSDPAEFSQLFQSYRTLPIASFGPIFGTNFTSIRTPDLYVQPKDLGKYTSSGFAYQGGVSFKRYIIDKLDLNLEVIYSSSSYKYSASLEMGPPDNTSANINSQSFTETMTYIELPLTAVYTPFSLKLLNPYLRGGISYGYLLSDDATYPLQNDAISKPIQNESSSSIMDYRKPYQFYFVMGGGVNLNLSHGNLYLDVRYNLGSNNHVKADNRLGNVYNQIYNQYIDNNIKISTLWFSIGYFYKFYKPLKKQG